MPAVLTWLAGSLGGAKWEQLGLPSAVVVLATFLLLAQARRTLNTKLMDLAMHTLERHGPAIADAAALLEEARELQERYASYGTQVRLARIDDARSMTSASASPDAAHEFQATF